MKIGFKNDVQLVFDGGYWDDEKKGWLRNFFGALNLDVFPTGENVKLEARSWKEGEGLVHVDTCPDDLDYATIYSTGIKYSGIAMLDRDRYKVDVEKNGMKIKDSVLEMSVGFFVG